MRNIRAILLGSLAVSFPLGVSADGIHFESADRVHFKSAGVRYGFSSAEGTESFRQAEVFSELALPWRCRIGTNWYVLPQIEFSAGWIGDDFANAFIATAGPRFVLGHERFPVTAFIGSNPTIMSRDQFEDRDFGTPFQFTTYAGIECKAGKHLYFGYRYQHMSNGGLAEPNPGLNLHMVSVGWRF